MTAMKYPNQNADDKSGRGESRPRPLPNVVNLDCASELADDILVWASAPRRRLEGQMKVITHTFWFFIALATLIFLGLIVALPGYV
jgi:hypothetical protein